MNEWSPQEFYSGPLTPDQPPMTVYRQYWEDNWKAEAKPNIKSTINGFKMRDQQPTIASQNFLTDDVGISPYISSKKKQNGFSDPRFKRVLNSDVRAGGSADANPGKIINVANIQQVLNEDSSLADKVISYLKIPNDSSLFSSPNATKLSNEEEVLRDLSDVVTKDVGLEPSEKYKQCPNNGLTHGSGQNFKEPSNIDCFGNFEKIKNNSNENLKRSLSDCTMNTKNTFGDENENDENDNRHRAKPCPSATRLKKVHNWIRNYKIPAEKRRSVITVIGQTQSKPFSKILNEINQRRKLAKELDKHALCRAIMESAETQADVKNLIAKVDFVLPDGKIIYSTERIYLRKESNGFQIDKDGDNFVQTNLNGSEVSENLRKRCEMIPERDSSVCQIGKRNKLKRSSRKPGSPIKEKSRINDNLKVYSTKALAFLFWPFLVLLCCLLCAYAYYYKFRCPYSFFLSDFLRPKNRAWYKKILL